MNGILLACLGVLILTPDALLIRLSELSAAPLVAWRGLALGGIFILAATATGQIRHLPRLGSGVGLALVAAQWVNAAAFAPAISLAPVALVLIAVATIPICAALWSWILYRQPTNRATWITILLVCLGVTLAMTGKGNITLTPTVMLGVLCGFGVAVSLSLSFTLLRNHPDMPLLLAVGIGALLSGAVAMAFTEPVALTQGTTWAIALASFFVLPLSFYLMSEASRHTASVNVSLILLLETVLGPVWVWAVLGEVPTQRMLIGGAIVVASLAAFLIHMRKAG